jgi:hypothetical protein
MRFPSITLVVTLAVLLTRGHCTNCDLTCTPSDAVHIIVARGSTESPGMGTMGLTANQTVAKIPGSDAVGLDYPAIYPPIRPSEPEGVAALTQYVTEYIDGCPNSKVVLMGYSQGAMVTMDTLCGTSSAGFATTSALDSKYAANSKRTLPHIYAQKSLTLRSRRGRPLRRSIVGHRSVMGPRQCH